jgi:hypothetical protein
VYPSKAFFYFYDYFWFILKLVKCWGALRVPMEDARGGQSILWPVGKKRTAQ